MINQSTDSAHAHLVLLIGVIVPILCRHLLSPTSCHKNLSLLKKRKRQRRRSKLLKLLQSFLPLFTGNIPVCELKVTFQNRQHSVIV